VIRSEACQHAGDQAAPIDPKEVSKLLLKGCLTDFRARFGGTAVARPDRWSRAGGTGRGEAKPLEVVIDRGEHVGRDDAAEVQRRRVARHPRVPAAPTLAAALGHAGGSVPSNRLSAAGDTVVELG
jgi:hypothetical protein